MLKSKPFDRRLQEDEHKKKQPVIPIRLNDELEEMLKVTKLLINQPKKGTCLKFLAKLGYECITRSENKLIIETVKTNLKNNKRQGLEIID